MLDVRILGPLLVERDGELRPVDGRLRQALVVRLALAGGRTVARDRLIADLWGEDVGPAARNGLQALVAAVRRRGDAALVRSSPSGYALGEGVGTDLDRFERHLRAGREREDDLAAAAALSLAVRLWRGPLLDGADVPFADAARRALHERRLQALQALGAAQMRLGAAAAAVETLMAPVRDEPLREELVALLVAALSGAGRRAEALALIDATRRLLRDELGVDPGPALLEAQRLALRDDRAHPPRLRLRDGGPRPRPAMIGREHELADVRALLAGARLVTITGPAGVGKTRLAEAVVEEDPEGAAFVPLIGARRAEDVPAVVAAALGLQARGEALLATLAEGLRATPGLRLLVLDNLEHLPGAAAVVERLLVGVPGLAVLATSRSPLHLPVEHRLPLRPVDSGGTASTAARIFLQRARRTDPHFALDPSEGDDLARVLTACEGLPLALELAAGWLDVLPVPQLASRLADRRVPLIDPRAEAGDRHASMAAAVDWSVDRLPPGPRAALEAAAVFAGGCTLPGLAAVAGLQEGAAAAHLAALVDRSLLQRTGDRFDLLHVVRERLLAITAPDRLQVLRHAHLRLVHAPIADVPRSRAWPSTTADAALLRAEQSNVREAVRFAAEHDLPRLADLLTTGSTGWVLLGGEAELTGWCEALLARDDLGPAARFDGLLALERAVGLHGGPRSRSLLREARSLAGAVDHDRRVALQVRVAYAGFFTGDAARARADLHELRAMLRDVDGLEPALLADQLAAMLLLAERPDEAAAAQQEVLRRATRAGLVLLARTFGLNLTELLLRADRPADAEERCFQLLAEVESEEATLRGQLLVQLGLSLVLQHRFERAAAVFRLALPLLRGSTFDAERLLVVLAASSGRLCPAAPEDLRALRRGWEGAAAHRAEGPDHVERRLLDLAGPSSPLPPEPDPEPVAVLTARVLRLLGAAG